jgi:hypothetical protein
VTTDPTSPLVHVLRNFPGADESPAAIEDLCLSAGLTQDISIALAPILVDVLGLFDAVRTFVPGAGRPVLVKANGPTAALFLRSLAEHVHAGLPILGNWARAGAVPPYAALDALAGPQFLHLIEQQRLRADPAAPALRRVEVAQVVVKARLRGRGLRYLVLHDPAARQFQLPGGHRRPGDADLHQVAIRELSEEVTGFVFNPATDRLVELGSADIRAVSRTSGALTEYAMTIFHLRSTRATVSAGPNGRWVAGSVLTQQDAAVAGQTLNTAGLRDVLGRLPGGLTNLELSVRSTPDGGVRGLARSKPLEFWGFVIGVLGLLISVVAFFVTA